MSVRIPLAFDSLGSGLPCVWLHAFPFSRELWRPQLIALADRARNLAPDFPGFGDSPGTSNNIEAMADKVAEWLDAIGESRPIVLGGCSMGGAVAVAFARRHAVRLAGLILIDMKAETDDDTIKANRTRMIESANTLTITQVMDTMVPRVLGATTLATRPEVVANVRAIGLKQSIAAVVGGQIALRDRPDARPGLPSIRVPTLVLGGTEDVITPPAVTRSIAEAIPGSRLILLDDVGHLPNLEAPERFNAAVKSFLDELVRS